MSKTDPTRDDRRSGMQLVRPAKLPLVTPGGIQFRAATALDVPAYAVMVYSGSIEQSGATIIPEMQQMDKMVPGPFYVNGASPVPAGELGTCWRADESPVRALFNSYTYHSVYPGIETDTLHSQWGPAPNSWQLHYGLPGFNIIGVSDPDEAVIAVVANHNMTFWAKAKLNWIYGGAFPPGRQLYCYPCARANGAVVYDGTEQYGYTFPEIVLQVGLPVPAHTLSYDDAYGHPNIVADDVVFCGPAAGHIGDYQWAYMVISPYVDDPIGTVKIWVGNPAYVPSGWAIMDGTANSSGNGGSGFDMRGRFPVGLDSADADFDTLGETGGTKSHSHGTAYVTAGIATTGGNTTMSHVPPYRAIYFIERLDNSWS